MTDQRPTPHERINFNLRPAKRIERKLIGEALACIYRYDTPRRFAYVGMGSYYFSDFILFHRLFGLDKMISIESDIDHEARFLFNKPFDCIEMAWGTTSEQLPTLSIFDERPVICWLDYYSSLTDSVIGDVQTVLRRAQPGSALLVTLNSKGFESPQRLRSFKAGLAPETLRLSNESLLGQGPKGVAAFMTEVLIASIEPTILDLNAGRVEADKIEIKQIVKLIYKDGEPMVTIGWLVLNAAQSASLDAHPVALDAPGIALFGAELMEITAPVLTFREIAYLKSILPNGLSDAEFDTKVGVIPAEDARLFSRLYRYFPSFADVEE
nr:O-methyltransferase [Rhodoferax sp.]